MTDPVADLLTRIRNALLRRKESVSAPHSKLKHELLKLLVKEGFISGVKKVKRDFAELDVSLKYVNEESAIREIQRESKPGLRKYVSYKDIKPYKGGLGIRILSTSKGLRTDKQAIKDQLGGEIICRVF
ncbi:MAG: 30S ribosomal protein S8 [Gammaproteobacteria bacterium]|jgi:small subunit ribosomal protein S8|uniref:Small ribosomal subunit protein uS8 n=1 Tax=SAR86 cluster bacterium TaxID=2030880 RepID=A0A520MY11_9GAMM|nr:30S ribosomal protein S8 [Gammaproteobacteria bacterium]MBA4730072.1 30S ribosomal protein S8 [SAR86 cluster bacterium]RPG35484.1 MAG: 30S ribosomal protein S8 [Gammaproteobacteria bacterium TMED193]RZO26127.1 MAG: 30S ribosomal protein S8 [SAR86 cluster bacterium]|tara:strand:- start:6211 stop:6597 length:387 start_codon:yes stop_codon:yes gene_type:complete